MIKEYPTGRIIWWEWFDEWKSCRDTCPCWESSAWGTVVSACFDQSCQFFMGEEVLLDWLLIDDFEGYHKRSILEYPNWVCPQYSQNLHPTILEDSTIPWRPFWTCHSRINFLEKFLNFYHDNLIRSIWNSYLVLIWTYTTKQLLL